MTLSHKIINGSLGWTGGELIQTTAVKSLNHRRWFSDTGHWGVTELASEAIPALSKEVSDKHPVVGINYTTPSTLT